MRSINRRIYCGLPVRAAPPARTQFRSLATGAVWGSGVVFPANIHQRSIDCPVLTYGAGATSLKGQSLFPLLPTNQRTAWHGQAGMMVKIDAINNLANGFPGSRLAFTRFPRSRKLLKEMSPKCVLRNDFFRSGNGLKLVVVLMAPGYTVLA